MPKSTEKAFSLIEAAVAIAIMAILAGAAMPLVLKAVNQQREQKTRESLKVAYEGIFGARDRRIVNMVADFGFTPAASPNLSFMTTQGAVRAYAQNVGDPYFWGWNGPYWNGSIQPSAGTGGIPLDGWGRPMRLVGSPWQVVSNGVDGVQNTADDLIYPTSGVGLTTSVQVSLNRVVPTTALPVTLRVTVQDRSGGLLNPVTAGSHDFLLSETKGFPAVSVNPGSVLIHAVSVPVSGPSDPAYDQTMVLDLLPGSAQAFTFTYNN